MSEIDTVLEMLKENDVKFVDFRFTDSKGKSHHMSKHVGFVSEKTMKNGIPFDGSSIAGWKPINQSDTLLMPDPTTAVMDPFTAQSTMIITCDVVEPGSNTYYPRDPRSTAKRAESYLISSGIADTSYWGPEAEFFVFDQVRYKVSMNNTFYELFSEEGPYVSGMELSGGNSGHRPGVKGGYMPVAPVDSANDMRAEMMTIMKNMGLDVEKHHHEVAPSQHELGFKYDTLVRTADNMQIYKYVVQMVAQAYGKTATFMPKPVVDDNGSGMHVHQSLWKEGKNLFMGDQYGGLSELALYYIGGIFKHAKAINAFTNPTTNSYKRLVPGFEAPVLLAYSTSNRSASCRIPADPSGNNNAARIEIRFPDPAANPYFAYAVMLMAGIDGIVNKIHPGQAIEKNLYDLPIDEVSAIPTVCGSLREALNALHDDREFLKRGDVFSDDLIDAYLEVKWEEVYALEHTPHPIEFQMYYSV